MTLQEISREYRASGQLLSQRLRQLRQAARASGDAEERWRIRRRIARLTEMLTQTNELAELTERYYERGYQGNGKYRI